MSDSIPPTHLFVRPGQVRSDLPPPDHCVACGAPEAAHSAEPSNYVENPELTALKITYPGWMIAPGLFGGFKAEWRSPGGLQIHVVHGTSISDLHRRLETIEQARGESE